MVDSVQASVEEDTAFLEMFFCLFATTLASFLGLLVTAFFAFHIWLMTRAMTTIDFCEKSLKRSKDYDNVLYDLGLWGNIKAVLGPNLLLFLLPLSPPKGDGLSYVTEATWLNVDQSKAKVKKKGHRIIQRNPHDPEGGQQPVGHYAATDQANT